MKLTKITTAVLLGITQLQSAPLRAGTAEVKLDEIVVKEKSASASADLLSGGNRASDIKVQKEKLRARSGTLGNALNDEIGVHSNQFGGGASAPIICGQEGVRVKILQNGMDSVDMSTLSPDHAVPVDTLLAGKVEVLRGATTMLYSTASTADVINVSDQKIPRASLKMVSRVISTCVITKTAERTHKPSAQHWGWVSILPYA